MSPPLACPLLLVKAITAAFGEAKPSDPTTVDELCALRTMAARLSRVRVLTFLSLVSLPTHQSLGGVFLTTPRHSRSWCPVMNQWSMDGTLSQMKCLLKITLAGCWQVQASSQTACYGLLFWLVALILNPWDWHYFYVSAPMSSPWWAVENWSNYRPCVFTCKSAFCWLECAPVSMGFPWGCWKGGCRGDLQVF